MMLVRAKNHEQKLSNLDKVFYPAENITKGDLIKFYLEINEYILPHLINRPMVMKRYPDGIQGEYFYQKQCPDHAPPWITKATIDKYPMVVVDNLDTLIWCINLGCIELHPWLSSLTNLENPDIIVFDLDPEPPATFVHTLEVALIIQEILDAAKLKGYVKTSGNEGLHIYVPIIPQHPFPVIKETLKNLCNYLTALHPSLVTTQLTKEKRKGKVYLDFLQNGYGKTMASVYSIRPVPGAPVSTPLSWDEVRKGVEASEFNIFTIKPRLEEIGDIFLPVTRSDQDFYPIVKALLKK